MDTSNTAAGRTTIGRTDRNHLEVVDKIDGGLKIAVLDKNKILKAFVYVGPEILSRESRLSAHFPPFKEDECCGYIICRVEGYCLQGDSIDIRRTVANLLSDDRYEKLMAPNGF